MMIYNLVFICVMTMLGLINMDSAISDDEGGAFIISTLIFICGILAIIFQLINL
jgi:hypothetical protein